VTSVLPLVDPPLVPLVRRDLDALDDTGLAHALGERPAALAALERECGSAPRLLAGALAWLAGVLGGAALCLVAWDGASPVVRVLGAVAGAALVAWAWWFGRRVWHAGRDVVAAYATWTTLPERLPGGGAGFHGWRGDPVGDAVAARVLVLQPARFARIAVGALAWLGCLSSFMILVVGGQGYDPTWFGGQRAALAIFGLVASVACGFVGTAAMGGQWRANLAHSQRDPVQRRLLGRG
jgi:hypothetical protein